MTPTNQARCGHALAVPLIAGPTVLRALGSVLFFGVLLLPLGVLLLAAGESAGVVACLQGAG